MGGFWGMCATGIFDMDRGILYGATFDDCLAPNLLGCVSIIAWAAVTTIPVFLALNSVGLLRYDEALQVRGLDTKFTPQSPATQLRAFMGTQASPAPGNGKVSPAQVSPAQEA
jgi:ammonia channel protein AmtB